MRDVRTWIEIDSAALRHNVAVFRARAGGGRTLMVVVKSNAYGHGLWIVARALRRERGLAFGVDSIPEALRLRREGIRNSILILGYTLPGRLAEAARGRIAVSISNFAALKTLSSSAARPQFHLKLDTGMHRQGFQEHEIPALANALQKSGLRPVGVYSHYAFPEDAAASRRQRATFYRSVRVLRVSGINPGILHLSATGGVWERRDHYPMVRVGFGIYGYLRRPVRKNPLRAVMTWKTVVSEVKRIKKGERIGYDLTERFLRDSVIAILPVGYWHGYSRRLSSVGVVLVHGKRVKVMGRVSMDMIAIDVTDISSRVKIGDEVVLIGHQGKEFMSADEFAEKIGTSTYEVLTCINPLIRRIAV